MTVQMPCVHEPTGRTTAKALLGRAGGKKLDDACPKDGSIQTRDE